MVLKNKIFMLNANHKHHSHKISLCLSKLEKQTDLNLKNYTNLNFLHKAEKEYLSKIISEKRLESYVLGRYSAKKAILKQIENINPENILIKNGIFRQPILENKDLNLDVTISHCDNYSVSIAFNRELIFGADIEKCDDSKKEILKKIISLEEIEMFEDLHIDLVEKLTNIWAAKEALSKCLKTGINVDLKIFKINKFEATEYQIRGDFLHFPQYSFLTFKQDECIIAIAFPKNLEFQFDTATFTKIPFG